MKQKQYNRKLKQGSHYLTASKKVGMKYVISAKA